jgi:hypothetical protein
MIDWDILVRASPDEFRQTHDVQITVKVPYEQVYLMSRENVQHEMVEYIARRLHEFVANEFRQKRLGAPQKALPEP